MENIHSISITHGAGLGYQGDSMEGPHKLLYPAFLEIEDIEEQDLFNPRLLRGLIELQTQPETINGSEVDVFKALLPLLGGKVVKSLTSNLKI